MINTTSYIGEYVVVTLTIVEVPTRTTKKLVRTDGIQGRVGCQNVVGIATGSDDSGKHI